MCTARIMFSQPVHLSIMVVDPLCLVYTDVRNKLIFLSLLTKWQVTFSIVDSYDTLYLEGLNSLQYRFLMMGGKLVWSLDKKDHKSTVGVMYDPFVGMILAF
jgi:hypothetical protein